MTVVRRCAWLAVAVCLTWAWLAGFAPRHAWAADDDSLTRRIQDDSIAVAYSGAWTHVWGAAHSGWSVRRTSATGATAALRFTGTKAGVRARVGPDGGIAAVRMNGSTVATVSLYAEEPSSSVLVWVSDELPTATRVVSLVATGKREASSTGTAVALDAFDIAGTYVRPTPRIVQESDERVARSGRWRARFAPGASGGYARRSSSAGSAVRITFTGTSIAWLGRKGPDFGAAEVLLDGRRVAVVGGAPTTTAERTVVWAISGLAKKKHVLTIRAAGRPQAPGTGASVDIDGFIVGGTAQFTPRPTPFSYPWRTYIVVDKSDYRLYWVKDKVLVKSYPVAHGRKWTYTPHRVWRIDAKYRSSGVYGPRKMRLFKAVRTSRGTRYLFTAYNIHGTNNPASIGTMASAGCIRMYNRDVLDLFPRVPLGTMVVTRG